MKHFSEMAGLGVALLVLTLSCTATEREDSNLTLDPGRAVAAAVAPKYSPVAVALELTGDVEVLVAVDRDGIVTSAEATTGHVLLQSGAVDAAKGWRFRKLPEATKIKLIFSFRVLTRDAAEREASVTFFPPNRVEVISRPAAPPPVQNDR